MDNTKKPCCQVFDEMQEFFADLDTLVGHYVDETAQPGAACDPDSMKEVAKKLYEKNGTSIEARFYDIAKTDKDMAGMMLYRHLLMSIVMDEVRHNITLSFNEMFKDWLIIPGMIGRSIRPGDHD